MPITAASVGITAEPVVHDIDTRWLMAYAAGIGRHDACYLDSRREGGVVAHPLFPVCVEWPAVLAMRDRLGEAGLSRDEAARGVHHSHDVVIHRPARAGDRLRTTATLASIDAHRSGTLAVLQLDTVADDGEPVASTAMATLYRHAVTKTPTDRRPDRALQTGVEPRVTLRVPIAPTAAHVYAECSRIWNPIHTDPRTAERAGLPGIILHGTATLALALSAVIDHEAGGRPERIGRAGGRFVGMVRLPSEIEIRVLERRAGPPGAGEVVAFDVRDATGRPVITDGLAVVTGS